MYSRCRAIVGDLVTVCGRFVTRIVAFGDEALLGRAVASRNNKVASYGRKAVWLPYLAINTISTTKTIITIKAIMANSFWYRARLSSPRSVGMWHFRFRLCASALFKIARAYSRGMGLSYRWRRARLVRLVCKFCKFCQLKG